MIATDLSTFTHGWTGLQVAYGAMALPMAVGLLKSRAPLSRWPRALWRALPAAVGVAAATVAANTLLPGWGEAGKALLDLTLGGTLSAGLGYAMGLSVGHREAVRVVYLRGSRVVKPRRSPIARLLQPTARDAVTLAGLPLSVPDETKHFKILGTTGTGKSTAIAELLRTALTRGDRAIIADPDGGYLERFFDPKRGDVILNPLEKTSVKWDLFGEIKSGSDVEQLARSLIPDHEGSDHSWSNYARTFFTAVTRQAHESGVKYVAELRRLLLVANRDELRTLVGGTPAQPFLEETNSRMFDSIRSVTASAVGALDYVARQQGPLMSIRDWVARGQVKDPTAAGGGVLFIPYRAGQIAALRTTISAWLRIAIFEAMDRPAGDQRLWFVVDELDALGQIDGLKDALARLRKFGGRCVLGFQSVAQVSSTYGVGAAQTIVENCGNTLILRCSSSEQGGTARFASQLIGQREISRSTVAKNWRGTDWLPSLSRSEHYSIEPVVMNSEIEQLPDLQGYLKFASSPDWHRVALTPVTPAPAPKRNSPGDAVAVPAATAVTAVTAAKSLDIAAHELALCNGARREWQRQNTRVPKPKLTPQRRLNTAARSRVTSLARDSADYF